MTKQHKKDNQTTSQLTIRPPAGRKPWTALTAILVVAVGVYFVFRSFAAGGTATLTLSPSSSTVSLGSNFTVTVRENSGTDQVNTAQAALTYPTSTLQYVSTDFSSGPFGVQAASTGGSGTVSFTVGSTQAYNIGTIAQSGTAITGTGTTFTSSMVGLTITYSDGTTATITAFTDATHLTSSVSKTVAAGSTYVIGAITGDQIVAVITFKAIGLGASQAVNFGCVYNSSTCPNGDLVLRSSDNGAETLTQTGGTYSVTDQTPPTVPTGLTKTTHTDTSLGISWTASTDNVATTGYKVYRNGTQISTTASASYNDTGLTPNTNYTYTVSANDAAGNNSAQSAGLAIATDPDTTLPTVPGTPTQTSRTMTSMVIGWTASTDDVSVTGYKVYRNGTQIGTAPTNSFSDAGPLAPNTSYTYKVSSYDAAGNNSAQSAGAALSTLPDSVPPSVPAGLNVTSKTSTTVGLSWTASTDNVAVTGYKIYLNSSSTALATVATTSYTATGLTGNTAYSFQVSAIDAVGNESAKSSVLVVTTVVNGDLNGDGHVNVFDLSIFLSHWQQSGTGLPEDFNSDNIVNVFDLSILLSNFGT